MTGAIEVESSVVGERKLNYGNEKFICGVVEGFYGRPWTQEQRKLLFKWMDRMGLNTYMYGPKDDCKHRAYWREMYSVEETDNLTSLINEAHSNNITFVYAISPGLDMTFSSTKDVQCLKKKLEQVAAFGCRSFAILFDDIDPHLCESDKNVFQSYGSAQAAVSNEVYEHLGQPEFMFCPTEYCASRAVPNVQNSEYLNTIGSKLLPGIEVLWTGPRVISKRISIQSLEEVAQALKRAPLIWDNIHANDYDFRRLFLGPYEGRSPEVIPYISGVLTNPNCEFESNFIAFHTLSQWCKSNNNRVKKDIISGDRLSPVMSDIKLETESDYCSDDDIPFRFDIRYQSRQALKLAIADWSKEFCSSRSVTKSARPVSLDVLPPPIPKALSSSTIVPEMLEDGYVNPVLSTVCNSLVDPVASDSEISTAEESIPETEPMECAPVINPSPMQTELEDSLPVLDTSDKSSELDGGMQVEITVNTEPTLPETKLACDVLTSDDILLLVDMFYLPFEHGKLGMQTLQDMHWLKMNVHHVSINPSNESPEFQQWQEKAASFHQTVAKFSVIVKKIMNIPNKALATELYPYLWDSLGVFNVCSAYIHWLGLGLMPYSSISLMQATSSTRFSNSYKEAISGGQQEPWLLRGGLQAEFQYMLPLENAADLIVGSPIPTFSKIFNLRPYSNSDKAAVYDICLKTCDDGTDGTEVFPDSPDLIGDRLLDRILSHGTNYSFVVEDDEGVYGYCIAELDAKSLNTHSQNTWLPHMCEKYPKPIKDDLSPSEEMILTFHNKLPEMPESLSNRYTAVLRADVLPNRSSCAISKLLISCTLAALKSNGAVGAYAELNVGDKYMLDMYMKWGFFIIGRPLEENDDTVFLGRLL